MEIQFKGKIAKNRKYLTKSNDIRLSRSAEGWQLTGFAHNPDGQDIKRSTMIQRQAHYGHQAGETVGISIIDTPQFCGRDTWPTLDEARRHLNEDVPLVSKWGSPSSHFGEHVAITLDGYGECILYDLAVTAWSW